MIKEGALLEMENKKKKQFYYFLFHDCIVKTKPQSFDKKTNLHQYQFVKKIALLTASVLSVPPSEDGNLLSPLFSPTQANLPLLCKGGEHLFLVVTEEEKKVVHYFPCVALEDKQEWMKAIGDTIIELKNNPLESGYITIGEGGEKG